MSNEIIETPPMTTIPVPGQPVVLVASADAPELFRQAHLVCGKITTVETAEQAAYVQDVMVEISQLAKQINTAREAAKAKYLEAGRKIDAAAKLWTKPLEALVAGLKQKQGEYVMRVEAARFRAQEEQTRRELAAAAEAKASGAETPALVLDVHVPDVASVPTRTDHDVIIEDIHAIPAEFLTVNTALIKRTILAGNSVPGARLEAKKVVVAR